MGRARREGGPRCRSPGGIDSEERGHGRDQGRESLHRLQEFGRRSGGYGGNHEDGAHRAEGHGFQNGDPPVGGSLDVERIRGGRGQSTTEFVGETLTGLGRLTGQFQGAHHATHADGGFDVGQPCVLVGHCSTIQDLDEFPGQRPATFLALDGGILAGGHDAAQVAQIEFVAVATRGLGPVEPFGDAQFGKEILGHLDDTVLGDERLTGGGEPGVLLGDALANRRNTLQRHFGDGALLGGNRVQNLATVLVLWLQALRFGPHRDLGRNLEARTTRTVTGGTLAPTIRSVPGTVVGTVPPSLPGLLAGALTGATTTLASARAGTIATPVTGTFTGSTATLVARGAGLGDGLEVRVVDLDPDRLELRRLGATLNDREDGEAIEVGLGLDLQHVSDLASGRQQRRRNDSLGLARTRGPPGPGAVGARTGEFDVDAP